MTKPIEALGFHLNVRNAVVLETGQPIPVETAKLIFERGEEYEATFSIPADLFRDSSIQVLKAQLN